MDENAREIFRKRRVIYNDDADAAWRLPPAKEGANAVLSARFNWCINSQVDSYFWCVGNGQQNPWGYPTPEWGDPNQLMLNSAHKVGIEIFASLRMNDTHDAFKPGELFEAHELKPKRPDLLVSEKKDYPRESIEGYTWSALDYAKEEVRLYRLSYVKYICSKYDWDGFEMDFCRHQRYFKLGEEEENFDTMTGFVREIRSCLNEIAERRGRPYLLAVRVPDVPMYCQRVGLDIERWLAEGSIDILIAGGGYKPYSTEFRYFVDLGHRYGVPVYPCINISVASPLNTGDTKERHIAERIRAMASNIWFEGGDGVYLFNLFVPVDVDNISPPKVYSVLNEIGDPYKLQYLDKIYQAETLRSQIIMQYTSSPYILPSRLIDCVPIPLKVGDAVERHQKEGFLKKLLVRIRITDLLKEESIKLYLNGKPVDIERSGKEEEIERCGKIHFTKGRRGGTWFEGKVASPPLHRGTNLVEIFPSIGCWGKETTMIQDIQLWVRYTGK